MLSIKKGPRALVLGRLPFHLERYHVAVQSISFFSFLYVCGMDFICSCYLSVCFVFAEDQVQAHR